LKAFLVNMATFCLMKPDVEKIKKALKDGTIDPVKMAGMASEARHKFLSSFVGETNAKQVNSLFESKLLLKNQKQAYITWAKRLIGLSKEVKQDMFSRIEKLDRVLNPKENEQFLQDLASTRLKVDVSQTEAKKIFDLSQKIQELKAKTDTTKYDVPLGLARLDLMDYINSLGGKKADFLTNIANIPQTLMTSLDLSAPLNQGWGMVSRKRFYTSLYTMLKSSVSKESFRNLQAETITNPNYQLAKKSGLRLTDLGDKLNLREESMMSNIFDKVPGISASQRAYTAFLNKLRIDSFNDLIKKAEVAGEDITLGSKSVEDIAKVVNNFTGGARVGKIEGATPFLNAIFFSPRKINSAIQMINPVNYISPNISKTARLEATRNLIGSLALSASVIALYSLITGKKQETDPTSSDFGKIRSGDTRLDVTGGNATYINLLSRLITGRIKSSGGIIRKLGTKYGETSGFDLIAQFLRYKLSPNASLLVDAITKSNAIGEKKTIPESVMDRFKPMFANSTVELLKSDTDGKFGFTLASLFGAGLNTYSQETNWEESSNKEMKQFKEKIGENTFKKANEQFNTDYNEWFKTIIETEEYKKLSDENKKKVVTNGKEKIKENIFKKYNFKYKQPKETKTNKIEKQSVKRLFPK